MTPQLIKEYLELKLNLDLSDTSRKREIVEKRFIAFRLSKDLCHNVTLTSIGKAYNKDHATVLHGLKKFEDLKNQPSFLNSKKLYEESKKDIRETFDLVDNSADKYFQSISEIKQNYKIKFLIMIDKYHSIINKKTRVIENFSKRKVFEDIASLNDEDFKHLELRIKAFLIMNKSKKNKEVLKVS